MATCTYDAMGRRVRLVVRHSAQEGLIMSRAVAWYFAIFAASSAVRVAAGGFEGPLTGYDVAPIIVLLALAVGLYKRYRVARLAAIVVCALEVGVMMFMWLLSGCQDLVFLLLVAMAGLPLAGLLHPKSRIECVRRFRSAGPVNGSEELPKR